ncbi:MAG TPA: alpha/beta hydrolase, partial [Tepidiformaceae bacterium]|nr:alpha/beta hydrolase [Tepidiformaceae bacterium]
MAQLKRSASGLNYSASGAGSPAFVFLQAASSPATLWSAQVENLSTQHLCVVALAGDDGEDADNVSQLLGELQPGPVIVVAADSATDVALTLNERYPEAVTGVVLVNPALP